MADWKHLSGLIKGPTQNGSMPAGGKFSIPLREEQSLPQDENICSGAANETGHDNAPEDEAVDNREMQINQSEDPRIIDDAPQENNTRGPIGNIMCSGRSIKLTPRMVESTAQRDQRLVAWEVLLDQSNEEDKPMQEHQYELQ